MRVVSSFMKTTPNGLDSHKGDGGFAYGIDLVQAPLVLFVSIGCVSYPPEWIPNPRKIIKKNRRDMFSNKILSFKDMFRQILVSSSFE